MLSTKERTAFEICLIFVALGLTCLLYIMPGYKMVILDLFFLPAVLGAFFLGRQHGGVLALFCAISASLAATLNLGVMANGTTPLVISLSLTIWAASLGLTALLVGTLSDERAAKVKELHEAYVGVVEVLSQYLQSAHPRLKAWSIRVAELSQAVAASLRLTPRQIDDIRVAALLYDMGNIEVTTKVIRRAVGTYEDESGQTHKSTFRGADLMLSLGAVLSGAVPLLLSQGTSGGGSLSAVGETNEQGVPVGAKIIRAVRSYLLVVGGPANEATADRADVMARLEADEHEPHDPAVLAALQRTLDRLDHQVTTARTMAQALVETA